MAVAVAQVVRNSKPKYRDDQLDCTLATSIQLRVPPKDRVTRWLQCLGPKRLPISRQYGAESLCHAGWTSVLDKKSQHALRGGSGSILVGRRQPSICLARQPRPDPPRQCGTALCRHVPYAPRLRVPPQGEPDAAPVPPDPLCAGLRKQCFA